MEYDNNFSGNMENKIEELSHSPADLDSGEGDKKSSVSIPQISMPSAKSASIKGIGEKFQPTPSGSASMTVPIYTSPGRSEFGPELSISYSSNTGNGIFGLGWELSLPRISRKTEKELPQYIDSKETDTFILSGAEDLVPAFKKGTSVIDEFDEQFDDGRKYKVKRYIPRTEGLFARIERWTNKQDETDKHWRSITKDNITSVYGFTADARIANGAKTFCWLIEQQFDDRGNLILFKYDSDNDYDQYHKNAVTKYIKKILYGNREPVNKDFKYYQKLDYVDEKKFHFKAIFDYGDQVLDADNLPTISTDSSQIKPRKDPFSCFRSGFEIRSRRACCQRVLMFHDFPAEGLTNQLVKETEFGYEEKPEFTKLVSVTVNGYDRGKKLRKSLPTLEFKYSQIQLVDNKLNQPLKRVNEKSLANLPQGLSRPYRLLDLDGEGIPGIFVEADGTPQVPDSK